MGKRFSNNRKDKSLEGKYYRTTFKTNELKLHSRNIREYEPTDTMIEMMREYGFINEKPIVVVYENDIPSIVNGNQRKKTAEIVGIIEVPCMVFYDINDAIKFATIDNVQRKWTPYQEYKNAIDYYKSLISEGYKHLRAYKETIKDLGTKKYMLSDYIFISKLPNIVKALIKKPDNRKKDEKTAIERIDINNKLKRRVNKLKPEIAGYMGRCLINLIDDNIMCEIGIELISEKFKDAKIIIEAIAKNYPEQTPSETIKFYKTGSLHEQIQFTKNYEPEKYYEIVRRFVSLGMNVKLYISSLIEEDLKLVKERVSNGENNHIIKITGSIRTGFSFNEVKNKAWNNTKLPQLIKDFLNEIKFVNGNIYLKYDNYEIEIFKFKDKNQIDKKKKEKNGMIKKDKLIDELLLENKDLTKQIKELQRNKG